MLIYDKIYMLAFSQKDPQRRQKVLVGDFKQMQSLKLFVLIPSSFYKAILVENAENRFTLGLSFSTWYH